MVPYLSWVSWMKKTAYFTLVLQSLYIDIKKFLDLNVNSNNIKNRKIISGKSNGISILRWILPGIIASLILIIISGVGLAQINLDETKNIGNDMYYVISLTGIEAGEVLNVDIWVTRGDSVDVLLMTSSDYAKYLTAVQSEQGGTFNYYVDGSSNSIISITYNFTFPESRDYYLVIDNTANPIGGATPTGAVDVQAMITVVSQGPDQNEIQGIVENTNILNEEYILKLEQVAEIEKRTDALGTAATKEIYKEWKLKNYIAIESGERYASYITENINALDQKWVSDILVLISKNKVNLERDNQNLEQIINSPDSPGFEAPASSAPEGDGTDGWWVEILLIIVIPIGIILLRKKMDKSIEEKRKKELRKCPECGAKVIEKYRYCGECGKVLTSNDLIKIDNLKTDADPGTMQLCTKAWLLWGWIGSIPGVLKYDEGCLSFTAHGCGTLWKFQLRSLEKKMKKPGLADQLDNYEKAILFDAPLSEILNVRFPWYSFSSYVKLVIGGDEYRLTFMQPQNTKWPKDVKDRKDGKDSLDVFEIFDSIKEIIDSIKEIKDGRQVGKDWRRILLGE